MSSTTVYIGRPSSLYFTEKDIETQRVIESDGINAKLNGPGSDSL